MNGSYLLSLIENLLDLYKSKSIVAANGDLSEEFKSLVGDMMDAVSNVD